jgi:hypothetical protein
VARIRSIKPDFFTSETVASLPLSARLTFIGLWTYVDDNGVGLDNELLVTAAIWPLERDNLETLARTREDLARLSRERVVTRYRDSRKGYLFVTNWDEHQKVDHPRKPRYPRPDDPGITEAVTSVDADQRESLATSSRKPREDVAPEQGSGSRDQGAGNGAASPGTPKPRAARKPRIPSHNAGDVIAAYVEGAVAAGLDRPVEDLRKRVGNQAGRLMAEGVDLSKLVTAARNMGAAGWQDLAVQLQRDAAQANGKPAGVKPLIGVSPRDEHRYRK